MKKPKERQHVIVRPAPHSTGRTYWIVQWRPQRGNLQRLSFNDQKKANAEADRIEDAMSKSLGAVSTMSSKQLAAINHLSQLLPAGMTIDRAMQFYLDHHNATQAKSVTVETAGREFIASRASHDDFSKRHVSTVRQHINRFIAPFGPRPLDSIAHLEIKNYLNEIGNCGKTRNQHLITIRSFFRWSRDTQHYLPYGRPTAAEQVTAPKVTRTEHEVYTPEEFTRLMVFTPTVLVPFMALGQFAGVRSEERCRLSWHHWRADEDNKIVCDEDVTKTNKRRRIDVPPSLTLWLSAFRGTPNEPMVPWSSPYKLTRKIAKAAGVPWKQNALRAGYASYHLELFDNAALTAKNDGHTVNELETSYKSIRGVTKKAAAEIFAITPQAVLDYARRNNLPEPEWASKVFEIVVAGSG
jgi:integrase